MSYKCGRMLIEARHVPNFEAIRKTLRLKKYDDEHDPSPQEMLDFVESKAKNTFFLPIAFQKIVALALVHNTQGYDKAVSEDPTTALRPWTVECFAGDESVILRNFWKRFKEIRKEFNGQYPVFITCDRKRGTLPLIVNRSFVLEKAIVERSIKTYGKTPDDIIAAGNLKENPGFRMAADYHDIKPGLQDIVCKSDKWENSRPNYMNTYSRFTSDLAMEYSLPDVDEIDIGKSERLVRENKWNDLAKDAVAAALQNWNNYSVSCYVNNDETFFIDAMKEDYLNDPEKATYNVLPPNTNPYALVMPADKKEKQEATARQDEANDVHNRVDMKSAETYGSYEAAR